MSHESENIKWSEANFYWNSNPHYWVTVINVIEHQGGKNKWKKHDKDKSKRREVIRLLMWRKGIKIYDEEKEIKNIAMHIEDIKLIAEELKKNVQIIY